MPDPSGGYSTVWGELHIAPPLLKWIPDAEGAQQATGAEQQQCEGCNFVEGATQQMEWPLASFAGFNEDPMEHALNQLRLLQGDDDGLLFGFQNPSDL
eukprot:3673801-Prymnesium_polylepis.1